MVGDIKRALAFFGAAGAEHASDMVGPERASDMVECLDRMVRNLRIAPFSYRPAGEVPTDYTAECPSCGWWGSSVLLDGGGQIADTGNYSDASCPVCGSCDIRDWEGGT